jgi:archaellum component FlaC
METVLWVIGIHLFELLAVGIFLVIRKNNKLEEVITDQQQYIETLNILYSRLNESLNSLDEKVWVENDSELSEVFKNIKEIKDTIGSIYN